MLEQKINQVFGDDDPSHFGTGWWSGVLSALFGVLALGAVVCLHFPQLLTSPELRAFYPMAVMRIVIQGVIIGAIGTVFGVANGLAVVLGLKWFGLRLDPDVYYIDHLPISVNGWNFATVSLTALGICTIMTILPAYAASLVRPVDGLRYE